MIGCAMQREVSPLQLVGKLEELIAGKELPEGGTDTALAEHAISATATTNPLAIINDNLTKTGSLEVTCLGIFEE